MDYSINDILDFYKNISFNFNNRSIQLDYLETNDQLIEMLGGLALTNSVHEMFIKSVLNDHRAINEFSNSKNNTLIKLFKSPKDLKQFIEKTELDLTSAFSIYREEIKEVAPEISEYGELLEILVNQRVIRNDFLHGDFSFEQPIQKTLFDNEVVKFQKIHYLLLKIINYSYIANSDNIASLESIIKPKNLLFGKIKKLTPDQKNEVDKKINEILQNN